MNAPAFQSGRRSWRRIAARTALWVNTVSAVLCACSFVLSYFWFGAWDRIGGVTATVEFSRGHFECVFEEVRLRELIDRAHRRDPAAYLDDRSREIAWEQSLWARQFIGRYWLRPE